MSLDYQENAKSRRAIFLKVLMKFISAFGESLRTLKKTKFLHNGAYPCYSIYKTKDGAYAAVAAVEEKFWTDLSTLYSIPLSLEKRFDTHPDSFNKVSQVFLSMTSHEIEAKLGDKDLCLSIVAPTA